MKPSLFLVLLASASAFGSTPENSRFLFKDQADKEYFILESKITEYESYKRPIAVSFIRTKYGSYVEDVKTVFVLQGSNCKYSKGTIVKVHPVTGQAISSVEKWDSKKSDVNSVIAKEICSKLKK